MDNIKISCKGVADITVKQYGMTIEIEEAYAGFIHQIPADKIVLHCDDEMELLNAISEETIHEYLRCNGYIYNKG